MTTVLEHPPTPPMSSNEAGYSQYSFNHLHEAVAKAQYGTHNGPFDTSVLQLPSNHRSFFEDSTPTMSPQEAFSDACGNSYFTPPLNNARYEDLHFRNGQLYEKGTTSSRLSNGNSSPVSTANGAIYRGHNSMDGENDQMYGQYPECSPVTIKQTRSRQITTTKILGKDKSITRVRKTPRQRKNTADKVDKPKVPKLNGPLSEITSSYDHLPVRDMDSWANRPADVRREEAVRRGYVTRPMNSFMLYRSAYAERTKFWCLQNNHQVVSAVSGESWPLEPDHIREKYNQLANLERINHQAAHPGYKFSPTKAQTNKKRKGLKDEVQPEASDLEEIEETLECMNDSPDKRKRPSRQIKKQAKSQKYQEQPTSTHYIDYPGLTEGGACRSSFAATNPGKTPPVCMGSTDMTGSYYQTKVHASRSTPGPNGTAIIEDVTIQKTQAPGRLSSLFTSQPWIVDERSPEDYPWSQRSLEGIIQKNPKVDPALLVHDIGNSSDGFYENLLQENQSDDIDEGFEIDDFELDPLFYAESEGKMVDFRYSFGENGLSGQWGPDNSPLDSAIDVHSLPAFHESMHGYIDNVDPWNVTKDESFGNCSEFGHILKYDEWLEE